MGRASLLFRISAGLVAVTLAIVLALDMFGLLPRPADQRLAERARFAELVASQVVVSASLNLLPARALLSAAVERDEALLSAGLRAPGGRLLLSAGGHADLWQPSEPEGSTLTYVRVPLYQAGKLWATLELRFEEESTRRSLVAVAKNPTVRLFVALGAMCFVAYVIYMARTLRHLDPTAVIPARVQAALNVMAEGVLIIDRGEEIVLANAAVAERTGRSAAGLLGTKASELAWRCKDSDERPLEFPWAEAIRTAQTVMGTSLCLASEDGKVSTLIVNSSPVLDGWGRSKGAIVTLDDVTALEEKTEALEAALAELGKSRDEIRLHNDELQILATTDPLTGAANRRAFFESAEATFRAARAERTPLSFVMCDIDHFKRVNDNYGHATGDDVISALARLVISMVGSPRRVCRYGGEEFCVQLDGMNAEQAYQLAEGIRSKVATRGFARVPLTSSFGVASADAGVETAAQLIGKADEALYIAKEAGRNRVVVYGDPNFFGGQSPKPAAE